MAGLGTQSVIERAELVTPRLRVRAPRFYPNNLHVRIWRGPRLGNWPGLLYTGIFATPAREHSVVRASEESPGPFRGAPAITPVRQTPFDL